MPDLAPVLTSAGDLLAAALIASLLARRADRSNGSTGIRVRQLSLPGSGLHRQPKWLESATKVYPR